MRRAIIKWSLFFFALLIAGPVAWWLTGTLRGPDGGDHTSPILSQSPVLGLLRGLVALGVAGGVGLVGSRLVSAKWGLLLVGVVLAWAASGTGNIDDIVRIAPDRSILWRLAVEGLLLAIPAAAIGWVLLRTLPSAPPEQQRRGVGGGAGGGRFEEPSRYIAPVAAIGLALVAGALASWVIAQTTLKGQAVAAAVFAGLLAGIGTSLIPQRPAVWMSLAALVLLAAAGPVAGAVTSPTGAALAEAASGGRLLPAARILPLDWLAGAFIGLPIGLSWTSSITTK